MTTYEILITIVAVILFFTTAYLSIILINLENILNQPFYELIKYIKDLKRRNNEKNVFIRDISNICLTNDFTGIKDFIFKKVDRIKNLEKDLEREESKVKKLTEQIESDALTAENKIKKIEAEKNKGIDEANALVHAKNLQLKETSGKLAKIIEFIIENNKDEDIEAMLKEFDVFYVINAALLKGKRINQRQANIYRKLVKRFKILEKTHKRIYDRLRTVCSKHNEQVEPKRYKKRKITK